MAGRRTGPVPVTAPMETLSEVRHRKVLGPWQAATVVVGMVVGAGIFRSASGVAQMLDSGPMLLLAWGAGGLFALAGGRTGRRIEAGQGHPIRLGLRGCRLARGKRRDAGPGQRQGKHRTPFPSFHWSLRKEEQVCHKCPGEIWIKIAIISIYDRLLGALRVAWHGSGLGLRG